MQLNKTIYEKDPFEYSLLNDGVAQVNDDLSDLALKTLEFELRTFVCKGQYERGLERIFSSFIEHLRHGEQQPAVWISGFYGSGKSHLAKVAKVLWTDFKFPNGASARSLAKLPPSVTDLLKELSVEARKVGGTHAAGGTLGSSAGDNVRAALLSIIFRSAGLPVQVHLARFVMWLKHEGYYDLVKKEVEKSGKKFEEELRHLHVSIRIAEAVLKADGKFGDVKAIRDLLRTAYPQITDVSDDDMVADIKQALAANKSFPLTLVVLDELQQYIGDDPERAYLVQETVEACAASFGSRLLFVATGQAALSPKTPSLGKLMGRFTVSVALADTDVEEVIRETILAKKLKERAGLEAVLRNCLGEISRHLAGTRIGPRTEDELVMPLDYPILPVRRRFWEKVLQAVDVSGMVAQLRNQLHIAFNAVRTSADKPIGTVIPADFLYDEISPNLLLSSFIGKDVYERIQALSAGKERDKLKARLLKLIFLISKLPTEAGADIGLRATADSLADLLIADLASGSAELRKQIPSLLEELRSKDGAVISLGTGGTTEYRLQTVESTSWQAEYSRKEAELRASTARVELERIDRVKKDVQTIVSKLKLYQGVSKTPRSVTTLFDTVLPRDHDERICIWVQDGWLVDEKHVLAEAKRAGLEDPTVFVFIPGRDKSDLHAAIIAAKAARSTLDVRGTPSTPEGLDARKGMEKRLADAEADINRVVEAAYDEARVFQGGGNEVDGAKLSDKLQKATDQSMVRLYREFDKADHEAWSKVIEKAKQSAVDALAPVGHKGDTDKHPVCAAILADLGAGRKGDEVIKRFQEGRYGWPLDAIRGALLALLASGHIRAKDGTGAFVDAKFLGADLRRIAQVSYVPESVTVSKVQRIAVRSLLKEFGLECNADEEPLKAPLLAGKLRELREAAGGDPPLPERPQIGLITDLESKSGNELLAELAARKTDIQTMHKAWTDTIEAIRIRRPSWVQFEAMLAQAESLPEYESLAEGASVIISTRALLLSPDPVQPLLGEVTDALRTSLNKRRETYSEIFDAENENLRNDFEWQKLSPERQEALLTGASLTEIPAVDTSSAQTILTELEHYSLERWQERTEALKSRFESVRLKAAKELEPEVVQINLPRRTVRTEEELKSWIQEVEKLIHEKLSKGPVRL